MNEINNLYRTKQKLSVSGYRLMPFYSEQWKAYLMETSEYYIELYRELQKVPENWKMGAKESHFWMAAIDCMMSNLKQTLFTESARGVVKRLSVEKLDLIEDNIEVLKKPPIQLGRVLLNYWLLWRCLRNVWANSEVVYYHVAGGWPMVEENDSEWNKFAKDVEELGLKIQKARGDDPIGKLRTWVDERIRTAEDESVYREVMLGHKKIEPDVRLVENILRMIARVLEDRPEDVKKGNVGFDRDIFAEAFMEWAEMFKKAAKALPRVRKPYHGVFRAAYNWNRYGRLFFGGTAKFWNKIEKIILPEVDTKSALYPEMEPAVRRADIYNFRRSEGKDILVPFLGNVDKYFKKVADYNERLGEFYADAIQGDNSDTAGKSKNGITKKDADYFLRGPWNIFNFLKQTSFDNVKKFIALCLAQDVAKDSDCYLGITRAGYIIAALLGWAAHRPVACIAVNPVPHLGQLGYDLPSNTLLIDESFRTGYTQHLVFEYLKKKEKTNIKFFTMTSCRNWGYPGANVFPLSFLETPLDIKNNNGQLNPEELIQLNPLCSTAVQEWDIEKRLAGLATVDIDRLAEELKSAANISVQSSKRHNRQVNKYDITRITLFPDLHMRVIMWMALKVKKELKDLERQKKAPISKLVIFLGSEYAVAYSGLFTLVWKYWQEKGDYGNLPDVEWSPSVRGLQETAVIDKNNFCVFMDITYDTGHVCEERKARILERKEESDLAGTDVFNLVIAPFADKKEIGKMSKSSFLVELNCE